MTNMIVQIQIGCTKLTLDLLLQIATTMNTLPVILQKVRDQLLLIEVFQIVNFRLHAKNQSPYINQTADNLV